MSLATGYVAEQVFVMSQGALFCVLGLYQVCLWLNPRIRSQSVKETQIIHLVPLVLSNVLVFIIGMDTRCTRGILTPAIITVLAGVILQILLTAAILWWNLLLKVLSSNYGGGTQDSSAKFSLRDYRCVLTVWIIFIVMSSLSIVLVVVTHRERFASILVFAIAGVMIVTSCITRVFVRKVHAVRLKVTDSLKKNDHEEKANSMETFLLRNSALVFCVALSQIGAGVWIAITEVTMEQVVIPSDPQVYQPSVIILGAAIGMFTVSSFFLVNGWIHVSLREVCQFQSSKSGILSNIGLKQPLTTKT
eukprot:TRINITY_DN16131_c0_g1_i2.p1 TRINITY_DN16131_c0_g1~~TRINITY_DN16131_c0_g1_i2.p1  ORF type:complete len:305 (-),score=55.22 TRINITY_DN16131_c0_g1_i2:67-981(-)